ncbi:MAG: caspase family protein [Fimbriimonadales bacterium]|nr:caspase family protein [Fimbriimonadales bacterium]
MTLSGDATIWEVDTGTELCTLISFIDGGWAVVDPEGRYDVSSPDVKGVHWVMDMTPIALDEFKDKYYDPGLLAKKLGFSNEQPRTVPPLSEIKLPPKSTITVSEDGTSAQVLIESRGGGGIGTYEVLLNGAIIQEGAAPPGAETHRFTLDLRPHASRLLPKEMLDAGKENTLEVFATNEARSLKKGEPAGLPPSETPIQPPSLFILTAGVSDYQGTSQDLLFAAKDAIDFGKAMQYVGGKLIPEDRVHVTILASDKEANGHEGATKANIEKALKEIAAKATVSDTVIVYLSGHGRSPLGGDADYFFLTADAGTIDLEAAESRRVATLSGLEIAQRLNAIAANRKVLILDTCASGAVADDLTKRRQVSSDVRRAWERMQDRSGVYILAGSSADNVSYEASNFSQGLLTYSLLEPLNKVDPAILEGAEDGSLYIGIVRWFESTERRVGELVRELQLGGIQQPEFKTRSRSRSFPVGRLEKSDVGRIPIEQPKPIILLREFEDENREDRIGLTQALDSALRGFSARGGSVAYWPSVREHPSALGLVGSYRAAEDRVFVEAILQRFELADGRIERRTVARFAIEGTRGELEDLAKRIVEEARRRS